MYVLPMQASTMERVKVIFESPEPNRTSQFGHVEALHICSVGIPQFCDRQFRNDVLTHDENRIYRFKMPYAIWNMMCNVAITATSFIK